METPKPTWGSVGPGTLDQELQEPKGLNLNQNTSKGPPDFQGNQKAKEAAAKGLLPPRDHRRTKSCRSHKGLQQPQGTNRRSPEDLGGKGRVKDHYQPVGPGATMLGTTRATTRAEGIPLQSTSGTRILWKSGPGPISIAVIRKRYVPNKCLIVKRCTDGAKPVRGKQSLDARTGFVCFAPTSNKRVIPTGCGTPSTSSPL